MGRFPWGAFRDHGLWASIPFPRSFLSFRQTFRLRTDLVLHLTARRSLRGSRCALRAERNTQANVMWHFSNPTQKLSFLGGALSAGSACGVQGLPGSYFLRFFTSSAVPMKWVPLRPSAFSRKKKESKTILCKNNQPSLRLRPDSL